MFCCSGWTELEPIMLLPAVAEWMSLRVIYTVPLQQYKDTELVETQGRRHIGYGVEA